MLDPFPVLALHIAGVAIVAYLISHYVRSGYLAAALSVAVAIAVNSIAFLQRPEAAQVWRDLVLESLSHWQLDVDNLFGLLIAVALPFALSWYIANWVSPRVSPGECVNSNSRVTAKLSTLKMLIIVTLIGVWCSFCLLLR